MGNCWSKISRASQERRQDVGVSDSTPLPGSDLPARSETGSAALPQPDTRALLQDALNNLMQKLQTGVKEITEFEKILNDIGQAIDAYRNPQTPPIEVPEVISSNEDDAQQALDAVSKAMASVLENSVSSFFWPWNHLSARELPSVCLSALPGKRIASLATSHPLPEAGGNDFLVELQKVLGNVLGEVGKLHWITAAFSLVALVLKRVEQMQDNKQSFVDILERLHQLGKHLVKFFKMLPNESTQFLQGSTLVVGGAILCIVQLNSSHLKRFAYVNVSAANIEQLKEQISVQCQNFQLTIQEEVLKRASKLHSPFQPEDLSDLVGRQEAVNEILAVMQPASVQKYQAILLHGMGGIGKTAIGHTVVKEIATRITRTVHVEIGENASSNVICNCQRIICETFLVDKPPSIGNPSDGRGSLERCFQRCSFPVFLYIDNVFKKEDLMQLLPGKLVLPKDSYILVTSRYEGISQAFASSGIAWKTFHITGLERPDAEALFERHLGGRLEDKKGLKNFNCVLDLCDGWPLALEVIGSQLRESKQDSSAWNSTIDNLKGCKSVTGLDSDSVKEVLKWSYSTVSQDCKNVFLDIACLLRNADWDVVRALGTGSELDTLKALSIVKRVENDYRQSHVGMHDLFVALGKEQELSSKNRRSYRTEESTPESLEDIDDEDDWKSIEGLVLNGNLLLPAGKLDALHRTLRILQLGVKVHEDCQKVPRKLQICSVRNFPYRDLKGLNDLRVLEIHVAWNVTFDALVFPGTLQILRLEIGKSSSFHEKAFENCDRLHTLHISYFSNLFKLPSSLWDTCPIRVLELYSNSKLTSLPPGIHHLSSLEVFNCSNCPLEEFPNGLVELRNLRQVLVGGFGKVSGNVDASQLLQLEHLHLDFKNAEGDHLVHGFGELHALRTLRIEGWKSLQRLGDDFSQLTALTKLSFRGCASLTQLPDGPADGLALSELNLADCKDLQALPDGFFRASFLKQLDVGGCALLKGLPGGFGEMLVLSDLNLGGTKNLEPWSNGLSLVTSLETLTLDVNEASTALNTTLPPKSLNYRGLTECVSLASVPLRFENFTSLRNLTLQVSDSLIELPPGLGNLVSLDLLLLQGCRSLARLPADFSQLTSLESLEIRDCDSLEELPTDFGNLVSLCWVMIENCRIARLPDDFSNLKSLTVFMMISEALEELPSGFGNLVTLTELKLLECTSLRKLPDGWASLRALQELGLGGCENLQLLPDSVCELKNLTSLDLGGGLERLPENMGDLQSLKNLDLSGCEKLEALPESLTRLTGLEVLCLPSSTKMEQSKVVELLRGRTTLAIY